MLAPLNRVIIFVGDVQKCAAFYREIFDFKIVGDPAAKDWLELDTGGCRLAFHQAHGPNGVIDGPTGSPMHPHKIVFYSEDVAATRAQLVSRGAVMGDVKSFGSLTMCDGRDPEGHAFQICNRR